MKMSKKEIVKMVVLALVMGFVLACVATLLLHSVIPAGLIVLASYIGGGIASYTICKRKNAAVAA